MHIALLSQIKRTLAGAALATAVLGLCTPQAAKANTYQIDDGSAEDSIGLTGGGTFISLNSFTTLPGNNIIGSISIAWGTAAFPDATLNGLAYTAYLWSDPNGDGSPTDAVLLASAPGVISGAGTDTFNVSMIAPTAVLTANFFVGFAITHGNGQFPAAFDETAPISNRSFINLGGDPNDLTGAAAIESFGLVGNWLIRADSAVPEPSTYALIGLGLAGIVFLGRQRRIAAR